ncbi:serine protease 53-like [Anopheles merus]|uniref:serine protease 53-like n=1 Tax=Anopheles merus TaxID=30066 RepID=UPI001BE432C7|nr:serine protease 53-like [Anopheles merus]
MYCSLKWCFLLIGCLHWVAQTPDGHEDHLSCGRRKVKTNYLIHNGANAIAGHWPWHAAIFHRKGEQNEYACGGSILDNATILTASHCVSTLSGKISAALVTVHVGQIHLNETSDYSQTFDVREIIIHPGFSKASVIHDIALIKLRTNISMNRYVQPVCLWTMDSALELIVGRNGTIVGFGLSERDVVSEQLKQATIGVVDPYTCIASDRAVYGTHLTLDMFCGKGQNGVSACNGDSGGGMFFEVSGRWFVRGLVSFTPARGISGLCDPLKYTVYTDVAQYVEWIKQYVDQRVLPVESDVLEVDYEEKLRLFNFDTCGMKSSIVVDDWFLPWLGEVKVPNEDSPRCMVTLISDWYAVGPAHCFDIVGVTPYISLGGGTGNETATCYDGNKSTKCGVFEQIRKIQRVVVHPKFGKNNSTDNIALIELLSPADTSQPNVQPICMPVTPELRTNAKTNLYVASSYWTSRIAFNLPVRHMESDECTRQYAEKQVVLNLDHKRLCAVTDIDDKTFCSSPVSGAPLQEMKMFGGKVQYFLRGFELAGLACRSPTPPIYNNIEAYVDWILYNMRYNALAEVDDTDTEVTQQTLESEWSKLQQQPGNEKLRLFNMDQCGLISSDSNSTTEDIFIPWVGKFLTENHRKYEFTTSTVVLISEWYVLAPKTSVPDGVDWRYVTLGNGYRYTQNLEIKNIIFPPPDHPRQLFALIELFVPADLTNPYIKPICLPFMDGLHRNKPAEVILSYSNFINSYKMKKLKMADFQKCQQRLFHLGHPITLNTEASCAVEDFETFHQESLFSALGSPYLVRVPYEDGPRYFLYGMHVDASSILSRLPHGPYIFHKIERTDLAWILEHVR